MGIFITFEGIDGSGKTTVSRQIAQILGTDYDVVWTKEPTDRSLFTQLRRWQRDKVAGRENQVLTTEEMEEILSALPTETTPQQELLNFLLDRSLHADPIREELKTYDIVICDRYHDSTAAYQTEALCELVGIPNMLKQSGKSGELKAQLFDIFEQLKSPAYFGWPVPDLTILLDCSPEYAEKRRKQREAAEPNTIGELLNSMEGKTDLEAVRQRYKELAVRYSDRIVTIDADRAFHEVVADCLTAIGKKVEEYNEILQFNKKMQEESLSSEVTCCG